MNRKHLFLFLSFSLVQLISWSQKAIVTGVVRDALTGESVPGALLYWQDKKAGLAVNTDGTFSTELAFGEYTFVASAINYEESKKTVKINGKTHLEFDIILTSQKEIIITADIAVGRNVPVAVSNIGLKRIEEELGGREIATLANTTPGAYATRAGGGDGDARVTIRGFSGNNLAVMLDGVPVNDMENGAVYWSNWFGLDLATQTTQIQRGLGASKLVIPAVGGTMNLITRGIDSKQSIRIKQEYAYGAFSRSSFALNSGKTKKGWGFSLAGSYKTGNGWVDGTFTNGFFYYGKIEKIIGKHYLSLYALGAPQQHGQRLRSDAVAMYDQETAQSVGAPLTYDAGSVGEVSIFNGGINYNPDLGFLQRYDLVNGQRVNVQDREDFNGRVNFYHKPQVSLKDVWNINEKSFLSTVAYLSIGKGGGTRWNSNLTANDYLADGSVNVQSFFDSNVGNKIPLFSGSDYNINYQVDSVERYAVSNFVKASMNEHYWTGILSTYSNKISEKLTVSGGIDARYYRGLHYRKIIDLMGADYMIARQNFNTNDQNLIKRVGDTIDYNNDAYIAWGGLFGQIEYDGEDFSFFASISGAQTAYKRVDYFKPKVIEYIDSNGDLQQVPVGYVLPTVANPIALITDSTTVNTIDGMATFGSNAPGAKYQSTGWYSRPTFTLKTGFQYKINKNFSVFQNIGYLDKAPQFSQVYTNDNALFQNIQNEKIFSTEIGSSFKSKEFTVNVNAYWTMWKNKPYPYGVSVPNPLDPSTNIAVNIQGMNARHMGLEFELAYKITDQITLEALGSFGDWIWTSGDTVLINDDFNNPIYNVPGDPSSGRYQLVYDAAGVHVSDAAQTQLGGLIRYEWKNGAYVKMRYMYFDRYYAAMNPFQLNGDNAARESWQIPSYGLTELHGGYSFKFEKVKLDLRGSVFNVLNKKYIADANNNDQNALYNNKDFNFGASSAGVFFGQGRWFNLSLTATF